MRSQKAPSQPMGAITAEGNAMPLGLLALPLERRVLFCSTAEVRQGESVEARVGFSLVPSPEADRNRKAAVLSVSFLDAASNPLAPSHRALRKSDQYGHFAYVGVSGEAVSGEFDLQLKVPPKAVRVVMALLPFGNPTIRFGQVSVTTGLSS